jgi:hypothetical protein
MHGMNNKKGLFETGVPMAIYILFRECGPGSSVSIATGYGLDGPGIASR